jgi:alpha-aminoadipate carrier protein LysW
MVNCPKCDAVLDVEEDELDEGEPLICEDCGVHLIVTGIDPLEIEIDSDEEDDFDDEDEDFEDEDEEDEDEFEDEDEQDEEEEWR